MGRPRNTTKVQIPPRVKSFIPIGYYTDETKPVTLEVDEFESVRLLDYEDLSQAEAAEYMDVSRPTLTRIYERARSKMAKALVEAKQLDIEGGKAVFVGQWYYCGRCKSRFNTQQGRRAISCPLCGSSEIETAEGNK